MVFRKINWEPYLLGTPVTNLEDSFSLVPSGRRSGVSWFLLAKFSNFFCEGRLIKIFWEITCLPYWISYLQGIFLSLCISRHLKMPFLLTFAIWKFANSKLSDLIIFTMGGLISHLLDLKWFFIPDFVLCFLRYAVLSFNMRLWNCVKKRLSRLCVRTCWIRFVCLRN